MHRKRSLKYLVFNLFFLFFILSLPANAAFTASGGSNGRPYEYIPTASTGLEKVYIFDGLQQAELRFNTADPSNWTWYRYQTGLEDAQAVPLTDISLESDATVLKNPGAYGYYVSPGDTGLPLKVPSQPREGSVHSNNTLPQRFRMRP
jgi:hypothetical protein